MYVHLHSPVHLSVEHRIRENTKHALQWYRGWGAGALKTTDNVKASDYFWKTSCSSRLARFELKHACWWHDEIS